MIKINCYLKKQGQLFNDIQNWFEKCNVIVSRDPLTDVNFWICIRPDEAYLSPDITKTIVQVHDCYEHDIELCSKSKCVIFTHPIQFYLWKLKGFTGNYKIIPIGTRKNVQPFDTMPARPTVGFFTRENKHLEKQTPLFKKIVLEARKKLDFDVLLIGHKLGHISDIGTYEERAANISDYSRVDALFSSSISPGIPLSVYEALAAGKPVITTSRWFLFSNELIYQSINDNDLLSNFLYVLENREYFHQNRNKFCTSPFVLEDWVEKNISACYD